MTALGGSVRLDVSDFAPKVLDNINKSWVEAQLLCGGMAFQGRRQR
jgi:hypothetical protein